ncbi:ATP-binding protein [Streptomyces vinaceus]|uniref:ATP-binding protein n=1 Tax=Streptomyces vinaceus TaxID=1960 RepID=UPI003699622A
MAIVGYAADDLVHLIAELLDNAASFSSPDTWVVVSGQRMPDGRLLLEIRDSGIGMGEEQLAAAEQVLNQSAGGRTSASPWVCRGPAPQVRSRRTAVPELPRGARGRARPAGGAARAGTPACAEAGEPPPRRRPGPGAGPGRHALRSRAVAVAAMPDGHTAGGHAAGVEHPTLAIRAVDPNAPAPKRPQKPCAHESTSAGLPVRRRRPRAGSITAPAPAPNAAAFPGPGGDPAPGERPRRRHRPGRRTRHRHRAGEEER